MARLPTIPMSVDRHYRKCKRTTRSTRFPSFGWLCDFSKLPLEEKCQPGRLCKALHFGKVRYAVTDAALRFAVASAQAQNLDRDVIRPPALFSSTASRISESRTCPFPEMIALSRIPCRDIEEVSTIPNYKFKLIYNPSYASPELRCKSNSYRWKFETPSCRCGKLQTHGSHIPVAWGNLSLPGFKVASLVQLSQQAESEFHVLREMTIKLCQSLLFAVDPHLAFHVAENTRLQRERMKIRVWSKAQLYQVSVGKANLAVALSAMDLNLFNTKNQADQQMSTMDRWTVMQTLESDLRKYDSGLTYLSALLQKAKSELVSDGYISEERRKKILDAFCFWDYLFALTCVFAGPPQAKIEDQPTETVADQQNDERRASVVDYIDLHLERISTLESYATERENLSVDAEVRGFSLPSTDATDKHSATKLTSTGNSIELWTNWSASSGSAEENMCRLLSTLIWEGGDSDFCQTKPRSTLFSIESQQISHRQSRLVLLSEGVEAYKREGPKFMQRLVAKQKARVRDS